MLSAVSSTAAMPPWAQLLALSDSSRLVTRATRRLSASLRAMDWPAAPLPRMSTSYCFSKMSLALKGKGKNIARGVLFKGVPAPGRQPAESPVRRMN